ncbi:MAG: Crp/Fnr family transcriptional regulator [Ruminococcus sp.]|nr:Crp/Fnr family transcriptional regulator [Ruminococcus sp.]
MKEYYPIMQKSLPFENFTDEQLNVVTEKLELSPVFYTKGSVIFSQGESIASAGLILKGSVIAESVSYSGERRIIQTHSTGGLFGDVLMSSLNHPTPVSLIAKEDSCVVFLNFQRIAENTCDPLCRRVLTNMLHGIADKFWFLNRKIAYLSCKSLRGRIAMFLLDSKKEYGTTTFLLPYNRDELAALLGANRTALSRELGRMEKDEIISFYKNSFKILSTEKLRDCL